jgi:hypothetical protein
VAGNLLRHTHPVFGYSYKRQDLVKLNENVLRFKEHFGVEPATVAAVLNDVKTEYPKEFNIKDALVSFHWLECYGTECTIAGPWDIGCLHTLQTTVKRYAKNIGSLKKHKIVFGDFEEGDIYPYTVDGVHYATRKYFVLTLME